MGLCDMSSRRTLQDVAMYASRTSTRRVHLPRPQQPLLPVQIYVCVDDVGVLYWEAESVLSELSF